MTTLYGIPNCDTVKKARKWLETNDVSYTFHNYKKDGVPEKELKKWIKKVGWEVLLNRRGTTWRKLGDKTKDNINETSATKIMLGNPSIIKRPVIESGKTLLIGFDDSNYQQLLSGKK